MEGYSQRICSVNQACAWSLALALALIWSSCAQAKLKLPQHAAACIRWAAGDAETAIRLSGVDPSTSVIDVSVPALADETLASTISRDAQSFSLTEAKGVVKIQAGGPVGAMYGLEELTEQIRNEPADHGRPWNKLAAGLHSTHQAPFLEIRADNMFIHTSGTMDPRPPGGYPLLLNDLPMWRAYIDMLARDRYNLLDLHGAYDLESTSFPNLYPMLVHVPEYPKVGDEAVQKRNLDSLRAVIAYARSRGIRVALMNYSANNGRGGKYKNEPSVTGVPPDRLADYTAKAVALLIREVPDLYMLGFRVGESSQPASFYQDAYLKGIREANRPDLRLYTRSWKTTKSQLLPIAEAARNGFDIEIKYNGEQLGLPYQSMQGSAYGSYSYQDYLNVPADYRIIWQIRANGTHRFWAWENTDFIRRTVRSCRLGNALGYTLEPEVAYFSVYPKQYYRSEQDIHTYRYIWQKYWVWYYAWGRLGYNPDLPKSNFLRAFQRHYGPVGSTAYEAMQKSGRILPLAFAYRFQGPDQRDFSPETETGNFDTKKKRARQDLLQFAFNHPEDGRSFAGIDQYVQNRIAGKPDGRITPFMVATHLTDAAASTRRIIAAAPHAAGADADAWRLLRVDLLSAADLGDYYAARIRGMTYLDFALQTGDATDYRTAVSDLAQSRDAWRQLSQTADSVYRPLSNPLRRQVNFQWSSQIPLLQKRDATVAGFWKDHGTEKARLPLKSQSVADFGHVILSAAKAKDEVTVRCTASGGEAVSASVLWWKPLPSEVAWQHLPMTRQPGRSWKATVPIDSRGLMYMVELRNENGAAQNVPVEFSETPWQIIPPYPPTAK